MFESGPLGGAFLRDETRTRSARLDGGRDTVMMFAVDCVRRGRLCAKKVTARDRTVFAHREPALATAEIHQWNLVHRLPGDAAGSWSKFR